MLENNEVYHTMVTFAAGQSECSFELPVDKIPRKSDFDQYKVVITGIESEHPTKPPAVDTILTVSKHKFSLFRQIDDSSA